MPQQHTSSTRTPPAPTHRASPQGLLPQAAQTQTRTQSRGRRSQTAPGFALTLTLSHTHIQTHTTATPPHKHPVAANPAPSTLTKPR